MNILTYVNMYTSTNTSVRLILELEQLYQRLCDLNIDKIVYYHF